MRLRRPLVLLILLLPSLPGCIGFAYERTRIGLPRAIVAAERLEAGRTTLRETLERLGPPDLILRAGPVDRAYYTSWDSSYLKFVVEISARNVSWDAFVLALGSEELRLARLEFDRAGILRDVQTVTFESSQHGEYVALDSRLVENFLEDRVRALHLLEADDDEEDVEMDKPPRKDPM